MSTLALFVALGGGAFAASKFVAANGVVRLCVSRTGAAQVLRTGRRCGKGKAVVSLNQTGARGLQGPRGPQGPPGGAGVSYTAGSGLVLNGSTFGADLSQLQARIGACAADQLLQSVSQAGSPTCLRAHAYSGQGGNGSLTAAVSVPPGNWIVIGAETIQPQNSGGTDMVCNIDVNGTSFGHASSFAPQAHDENATPVALITTTNASGTAIQLICDAGGNPILSPGASIYALPIAAIN
jgi:hypothetical protein